MKGKTNNVPRERFGSTHFESSFLLGYLAIGPLGHWANTSSRFYGVWPRFSSLRFEEPLSPFYLPSTAKSKETVNRLFLRVWFPDKKHD